MKRYVRFEIILFTVLLSTYFLTSCEEKIKKSSTDIAVNDEGGIAVEKSPKRKLSADFKKYWYAGNAEITSYKLEQVRYGEVRDGHAVLIYVTEPFLGDKQVKADRSNSTNIPVLKLNSTKKYLTGIYPYSIMTSTFYPVHDNQHALKVSFSAQEWCGHVYAQLNNRKKYEIMSHSYFESEADQNLELNKTILENELWNKMRINPEELPVGDFKVIPSLEYIRLSHKDLKSYAAILSLTKNGNLSTYEINYPELERSLKINFTTVFPHTIESWTESFKSGFGDNAKTLVSKASKITTLKTPYWQQNGNNSLSLRDSLGL